MSLPPGVRVIERGWLSSNNILLLDGDDATLVDSGYVGHAGQTVALVKSALAGRRLRRLINTHSHSDHIGGNAALQREFACRIAIPAGIEQHVATWDEQALLLAQSAQRGERFRHDEVVADGDRLLMGGLAWRVHAAPGHDMDALVFHCPDARLPVDTVIPGHGAPFGDVEPALARAYRRLEAFEADPARLARNAIKGCFIFNLLDLESLPRAELAAYLERVPFFQDIGARWLGMDVDALAAWLVAELGRAGAIEMIDGRLRPTMAA